MKNFGIKYGMAIDLDKCIGCYACQVSCKNKNGFLCNEQCIKIYTYEKGIYPNFKKSFFPAVCNHCENPKCVKVCPKDALNLTKEGIVEYDEKKCIYCRACVSACSCGAISYNKKEKKLIKCDLCFERLNCGLQPVCVQGCMAKAICIGNLNNNESEIVKILKSNKENLYIQKECYSNTPKVYYIQRGENICDSLKKVDLSLDKFQVNCYSDYIDKKKNLNFKYINTVDMMCPAECSIRVLVKDGKAEKIFGNSKSLNNQGAICAKGAAGLELVYSSQRIKTPMMRTGERGSGKWKEVSWEYALEKIAKKLFDIKQKYGAETVILDCGDLTDTEPYMMLFNAYGTPHTYTHSSICDTNRRWGSKLLMGDERPLPDIQRPVLISDSEKKTKLKYEHNIKLLINIGANPLVATRFNYMSRGIPQAKVSNKMYYIVVDPAFTNSAAKADLWLPITPGTDAELLACILNYIIKNDDNSDVNSSYIDHDFIKNYTKNWEKFKKAFINKTKQKDNTNGLFYFSPEWGENKTGIEKSKIIQVSHLIGITKPAAIEIGMHGTAHHLTGEITSILANVIFAITGNIDVPGGLVFSGIIKPLLNFPSKNINKNPKISRSINGEKKYGTYKELHKDLYGDFPDAWKGTISTIPKNIEKGVTLKRGPFAGYSYPIKAFINRTGNPLYTGGNTNEWKKSFKLKKENEYLLELIVHIDTHINETGLYADFILPECSYLEKMGLSDQYTINPEIALRDRVIEPLYNSKPPFYIMQNLVKAMVAVGDKDIDESQFNCYKSEEDLLNKQLSKCPGLINVGQPIPYPEYPEKAIIEGVPENPNVYFEGKLIHRGENLTVKWLRENNGVATWPVSYYRYRLCKNNEPSGYYPVTKSKKFEFDFYCTLNLDKYFGYKDKPAFIWQENNSQFAKQKEEYPFYLITGRTHQTGTMTQICKSLSNLETEANRYCNDCNNLNEDKIAMPIFLINENDGKKLKICTGDLIRLENIKGNIIKGKVFLSDCIRSGVIKTTFGSGNRIVSNENFVKASSYTPNVNMMYDSDNINKITGMPSFGDIMVKIIKEEG